MREALLLSALVRLLSKLLLVLSTILFYDKLNKQNFTIDSILFGYYEAFCNAKCPCCLNRVHSRRQ